MSDKIYVGTRAASLKKGQEYKPFSRVTMWYDDEHYYTAGDDTGRTLEVNNPHATQQIVDNVLESVRGYTYRPYEATGVDIDPAFELGDAITINGFYSVIAQTTERLDGMGTVDISAPGSSELGSEFPIVGPVTRELQRRVKLGQKYQGVSITRKDGLVITETDGETDGAKVVLNSKKLAFYDAGGQEQLYFDPAEGVYKFRGALNVNDNFIVDKLGNVTMKGNLNLAEVSTIYWGKTPPNKKRFAVSTDGPWHDSMQSGDIYCCDWNYTTNQWGDPYKFVGTDGKDGVDGSDGRDANVTYGNIKAALQKASGITDAYFTMDEMGAPYIYSGKIFGAEIYAGDDESSNFARISSDGFELYKYGVAPPKFKVTVTESGNLVALTMGSGSKNDNGVFCIDKGTTFTRLYYTTRTGTMVGFRFDDDGTVGLIGESNLTFVLA